MYQKLKVFVKQQDDYAFAPALGFNIKKKFMTIPSGLFSIVLSVLTYWLWFSQLSIMLGFK